MSPTAARIHVADDAEALARRVAGRLIGLAAGSHGDGALPAVRVCPEGELTWFVDEAATPEP